LTTEIEQINWMHWIYRLIALIIDSIITGIVGYIIYILILPLLFTSTNILGFTYLAAPWYAFALLLPFIYGLILVLYSAFLEVSWGGMTIGKKLLGLQVQTAKGGKVTFDKAFIRNISKIFWPFLVLDWLLGIVTPGNKLQKFTDRIAGTVVVQVGKALFGTTSPPPSSPPPSPPPTPPSSS
jgi:uncharacterized RDD family membrane protein YckC